MATPAKGASGTAPTPTQITSSPFPAPSAVPMGRPLSHISPSARSLHPPQQQQQQYPSLEDAAAFSSPSALLALGLSGITPSPGPGGTAMSMGASGLGMGLTMSDALGMGLNMNMAAQLDLPLALAGGKDHESEKRRNMGEVVGLLRTRVGGRGVCRESIERLGRLEGFECMWQDNSLSIAGNSVDLEVEFGTGEGEERVVAVTLRHGDGEKREGASGILLRTLTGPTDGGATDGNATGWVSTGPFHANLGRLARLDGLSGEVNCFEAVEGVYRGLKTVWEAEQPGDGEGDGFWARLCHGRVGCPTLDAGQTVGLAVQYWVRRHRLLEGASLAEVFGWPRRRQTLHSVVVECEAGYPSLRVSDWTTTDADVDGKIHWTEPPGELVNARFVARLSPPVAVPLVVAAELYRAAGLALPELRGPAAFDALVGPTMSRAARVFSAYSHGRRRTVRHAYSFHALEHVPGFTLRDLPFSHPRQLEELLPILRQYALLASLLSIFTGETEKGETDTAMDETDTTEETQETRVSVSLRSPMASAPCLVLVFAHDGAPVSVSVEVRAGGRLAVTSPSAALDEQLARALAASEDLGVLVERARPRLPR